MHARACLRGLRGVAAPSTITPFPAASITQTTSEHQIEFPSWLEREKMQAALVDVIVKEREKKPGPWIGYQGEARGMGSPHHGVCVPKTMYGRRPRCKREIDYQRSVRV